MPTDTAHTPSTWIPIDEHPAVRGGLISRDQAYDAVKRGRCRAVWLSRRRLLVHVDLLDDLAQAGKPSGEPGGEK